MVLHSYYFTFQKKTRLWRAFTQLLVIIVVTNTINVKNNINIYIEGIPFFIRGWILIIKMQSLGFQKYQISKIFACGGPMFTLFLHNYVTFQKIRLRRAFTKLLMIIVATNTINAKTT